MRYLMLYRPEMDLEISPPPTESEMSTMMAFIEEMTKAGILLSTEGLRPTSLGAKVRIKDGQFSLTDGPFIDRNLQIGGYAIVQAESKSDAVDIAKKFLR